MILGAVCDGNQCFATSRNQCHRLGEARREPADSFVNASLQPDQAKFFRKSFTICSAIICSSPGCNMNELIARPGRPSPPPMAMEGVPARSICDACCAVNETFVSQVICICGT